MNRVWRGISLVVCLVLLGVGCTTQAKALAPSADPSPEAGEPQQASSHTLYLPVTWHRYDGLPAPFGVEASDWQPYDPAQLAEDVHQTGATWTRINALSWMKVERSKGVPYNWTETDTHLARIGEKGANTILIISRPPAWAALDPVNLPSGPIKSENMADFIRFVKASVERYSKPPYNIKYYELFNEPDGSGYCKMYSGLIGMWGEYGARYAEMLKAVYPAIKQVNPNAQVVFGGVAHSNFYIPNPAPGQKSGCFQQGFIDDVLNAGGGAYFDVFNFHYYSPQAAQWSAYGTDILGKLNYVKQKLAAHGLANKPIISTEVGEYGPAGDAAQQEIQAQYVLKVFSRGIAGGLKAIIWFSLHNGVNGTGLTQDGQPKLAWYAYRTMVDQFKGERFSRVLSAQEVSPNPAAPVAGFEGYAFHTVPQNDDLWVVWVNQGTANIAVRARSVTVIDKLGTPVTRTAGPDGLITLSLTTSPVYLQF